MSGTQSTPGWTNVPVRSTRKGLRLATAWIRGIQKRTLDVVVAAFLLTLALPVLPFIVLAIKLESPGPIFYRAPRVGYRFQPLDMLKFRKMHVDAEGSPLTVAGDARFTRIGALLTRTHLDELPQLWNVLHGDMSIVGPRPEEEQFVALHRDAYTRILSVRPGITGWAQLVYADEPGRLASAEDPVAYYVETLLPDKVRIDLMYVDGARTIDDLKVMLWTPLVTLLGRRVIIDAARSQPRLAS
jgi:lipopolysaccharide/colanic/teichoic acid biosynthesis glycosyltransferase